VAIDPDAPEVEADHRFLQVAQDDQRRPRIDLEPEPAVAVHDRRPEGAQRARRLRNPQPEVQRDGGRAGVRGGGSRKRQEATEDDQHAGRDAERPSAGQVLNAFSSRPHPVAGVHKC
jgi:hypothetical protein